MLAGVQIHRYFSKPEGWVLIHFEQYPEHQGLEVKYEPPKKYLQDPLIAGVKVGNGTARTTPKPNWTRTTRWPDLRK